MAAPKPATAKPKTTIAIIQPFIFGAIGGCAATTTIQPLDLVKVRLQLSGEGGSAVVKNPIVMTKAIYAEAGVLGFYRGLSAGLLRQCTYGMARLGLFRTFSDMMTVDGKITPLKGALAGLASGALGSVLGTPADLALIRMQADSTLPLAERRNYKNVFDALSRIIKEEGVKGMWAGNMPIVGRAMAMNVGMLTTYDQAKIYTNQQFGPGNTANFGASMIAGFFAAAFSLPFDFVKTRIQKQKPGVDGKLPYKGFVDCCVKTVKLEGPLAFYKGFATFYVRVAPHAVVTLNVIEFLNKSSKKYGWAD
jgi:solute carrier family 25 oxoglutarate transporter 11